MSTIFSPSLVPRDFIIEKERVMAPVERSREIPNAIGIESPVPRYLEM